MNFRNVAAVALLGLPAFTQPALAQQAAPRAQRVQTITRVNVPGGYLGVAVVEVDAEIAKALGLKEALGMKEERGVEITKVDADSPASKAGLKEGDVLLGYNGQRIEGLLQFVRMVSESPVNRRAALEVFRNGATLNLSATIGQRPTPEFVISPDPWAAPAPLAPPAPAVTPEIAMPDIPSGMMGWQSSMLGYISEPVDGQLAEFFGVREGVLIRSVMKQSPAEKAGLKAGDVVVRVDGNTVRNPREITAIARRRRERKSLSFSVVRNRKELTLDLISWNENRSGDGPLC